jgi:hypothetical protein
VVFRGDEFEGGFLAAGFVGDGLPELGVGLGNGVHGRPFWGKGKERHYTGGTAGGEGKGFDLRFGWRKAGKLRRRFDIHKSAR